MDPGTQEKSEGNLEPTEKAKMHISMQKKRRVICTFSLDSGLCCEKEESKLQRHSEGEGFQRTPGRKTQVEQYSGCCVLQQLVSDSS